MHKGHIVGHHEARKRTKLSDSLLCEIKSSDNPFISETRWHFQSTSALPQSQGRETSAEIPLSSVILTSSRSHLSLKIAHADKACPSHRCYV